MRYGSVITPLIAFLMLSTILTGLTDGNSEDTYWTTENPDQIEMDPEGHFIENLGQWSEEISFVGETSYGRIALGPDALFHQIGSYSDQDKEEMITILKMSFLNSNDVLPIGLDRLSYPTSYFKGNDPSKWVSGAMSYKGVRYRNLWDGIDLDYIITEDGAKYSFTVMPGSKVSDIQIECEGQDGVEIKPGELIFSLPDDNNFIDSGLLTYYADDLSVIPARFSGNGRIFGFELKGRDPSRPVIIDPIIRSTFLGGSSSDNIQNIETDENGDYYVAGETFSTDFPTTPGTIKPGYSGVFGDMFITKMNKSLGTLDYSSIFGGSDAEEQGGLRVVDGEAIISGYTQSYDFQTTPGCYQNETKGGWRDGFVTRMNKTGTGLIFSTLISGSEDDFGMDIEIDKDGNIIFLGYTNSTDFPVTSDAYSSSISSTYDGWVVKLLPNGTDLVYASFMGGNGFDSLNGAIQDPSGDLFLYGSSSSNDLYFPSGAYDNTMSGPGDCWIIRTDFNISTIKRATLWGSVGYEALSDMVINSEGNLIMDAYGSGFPVTPGAFDQSQNGANDIVISEMDPTLSTLNFCTYLGGSGDERFSKLEIDSNDNIFISGYTQSTDFPTTPGAYDESYNGTNNVNAFVTKLDSDGTYLMYSTFLGGSGSEFNSESVQISDYNLVLVGRTNSPDFPVTKGAYDTKAPSGTNNKGYITELSLLSPPSKPMDLTSKMGYDWVELTWKTPPDDGGRPITGYQVWMVQKGHVPKIVQTVSSLTLTYNISGLIPDGDYQFYVKAVNTIGTSYPSNIIRFFDSIKPWIDMDLTTSDLTPLGKTTFSVRALDNTFLDSIFVEYWRGDHFGHMNISMEEVGPGTYSYSVDHPDEVFELGYVFHLNDTSNNWIESQRFSINITGDIRPTIASDMTPENVKAGDVLKFKVKAWDNDEIRSVHLEYWSNSQQSFNVTMDEISPDVFEYKYLTKRYSLVPIDYVFHVMDGSSHWNISEQRSVSVIDVDSPVLSSDRTPVEAYAGKSILFDIFISDNQRINDTWVHYSINDGLLMNESLVKGQGGSYQLTIDVPDVLGRISYTFYSIDENGNIGWLPVKEIPIIDIDDPEIIEDKTNISIFDPEVLELAFELKDNIEIGSAIVEYWFNDGDHLNTNLAGEVVWEGSIKFPSYMTGIISYFVTVFDSSGNSIESEVNTFNFEDVQKPVFIEDLTRPFAETGGDLNIIVRTIDNIGIRKVRLEYGYSDTLTDTMDLERKEIFYTANIKVPSDDISPFNYRYVIVDILGNTFVTEQFQVLIQDTILPEIIPQQDIKVSTKTSINLMIEASDNIGIAELKITGSPITPVDGKIVGIIEEPGIYLVTVEALDQSGNKDTFSFKIEVTSSDENNDDAKSGIPVWMMIPPILTIILLVISIILFFRKRSGKKDDPLHTPLPGSSESTSGISNPSIPDESPSELDGLFGS